MKTHQTPMFYPLYCQADKQENKFGAFLFIGNDTVLTQMDNINIQAIEIESWNKQYHQIMNNIPPNTNLHLHIFLLQLVLYARTPLLLHLENMNNLHGNQHSHHFHIPPHHHPLGNEKDGSKSRLRTTRKISNRADPWPEFSCALGYLWTCFSTWRPGGGGSRCTVACHICRWILNGWWAWRLPLWRVQLLLGNQTG